MNEPTCVCIMRDDITADWDDACPYHGKEGSMLAAVRLQRDGLVEQVRALKRALWDCLVETGEDVSGYCRGGPPDPFWSGTTADAYDAGFEQWSRMRSPADMVEEAVQAVAQLRGSYEDWRP